MKKLLTLGALVASVAIFAGCMNKPAVVEDTTTPVVEVAPTVEAVTGTETPAVEVTPAVDTTATPAPAQTPTAQ
ncbi:MAG: hypothetical protein WCJ45_06635 [bacterium]